MPIGVGISSVPKLCQSSDLTDVNIFSLLQAVSITPFADLFLSAERQDHRAVLVHVVPSVDRKNCEVYPDFINADRLAVANGNDQGITFCSEPCMDFSVALNQTAEAEAEATPDAWRPPTSLIAPDPVYGRRGRERMDYPRLADVGVQDDSVGCRKGA
jgi:hypothetical protein